MLVGVTHKKNNKWRLDSL